MGGGLGFAFFEGLCIIFGGLHEDRIRGNG